MELDNRLENFLCNIFGEKNRQILSINTTMDDIDEWDSLSFVRVIVGLEKEFGVKIGPNDAVSMSSVLSMQQYLIENDVL